MSTKKPNKSLNPDLIIVSDHYTNGVLHHERDLNIIIDILMEHIFLSCFTDDLTKVDGYGEYIGDFAMYSIESTFTNEGGIKFTKRNQIIYSQELFDFIRQIKGKVDFPIISNVSLLKHEVQELNSRLLICVSEVKENLTEIIRNTLEDLYKNNN